MNTKSRKWYDKAWAWAAHSQRMFDHPGLTHRDLLALLHIKGFIPSAKMNQSEVALREGVIRVSINTDGTFDILDFTLPSLGNKAKKNVPVEDVPEWIANAVAVLQIADPHLVVDGIGYRLPTGVFYLLDTANTKGETHDQEDQQG